MVKHLQRDTLDDLINFNTIGLSQVNSLLFSSIKWCHRLTTFSTISTNEHNLNSIITSIYEFINHTNYTNHFRF